MTRPSSPLLLDDDISKKLLLCLLLTWMLRKAGGDRYKARIVTIEVSDRNSSLSFEISRSGPAIKLAIEQSQALYNDTVELLWEFRAGSCGPEVVGAVAADVYYTTGVDVFIGPGCSKAVMPLAHMANSWNLPIITPVGNTEIIGNKNQFPRLTRTSYFMQGQFADVVVFLMEEYLWNTVAVINDQGTLYYDLLGLTFDQILDTREDLTWRRIPFTLSAIDDRDDFNIYLKEASRFARVIICLLDLMASRELLLAAHALGYTSGDYVFILPGLTEMPTMDLWKRNNTEEDKLARQAFESVILLVLAQPLAVPLDHFKKLMRRSSLEQYGYDYGSKEPETSVVIYYESVMMYTHVLNETLSAGGDPKDGIAMTKKMWNRTFQGLAGPLVVNEMGDRVSDIVVVDLNPSTGNFESVLVYRVENRSWQRQGTNGIFWPNGKGPPLNIPICGFRNENCDVKGEADRRITIALSVLFSGVLLIGLIVFSVIFRRWKKASQANLWWWRIEKAELAFINQSVIGSIVSLQSRARRRSSSSKQNRDPDSGIAIFKGQHVRLRRLAVKKPVINGCVLQEFKLVQEISAPNLVRVLGAYLEEPPFALVTEFCPKGTLQDILGQNTLSLDTQFKLSLATDVVQGLAYIHASPVQHHGRLSSATCLIDNRFTVKLTDFGLPSLFCQEIMDTTSQEYKRECLWRAPEILRGNAPSRGTREGDIYSFAIVLSEIVTRSSPYEHEADYLTLDEILERLKRGGEHEFRPSADVPANLSEFRALMTSCWGEDSRTRPTVVWVKKQLKGMAAKCGQSANFLDNLLRRMELYASNLEKMVEEKTEELAEEKKKADALLYEILPRGIADRLKRGLAVEAEHYECVTIYFSDIVGFTELSSTSTAMEVVDLLNDLYSTFDATLEGFDVYKIETIGDAYMVVSGLPHRNGNLHAQQIARVSLALRDVISVFKIRHRPKEKLQLRIGLHSGSVCAGVVGRKMPRYCLFGDTVNTASRMESNGEAMKIHMSGKTCELLQTFGTFDIATRGEVIIKGKGLMTTYWLLGEKKQRAAYP